MLFGISTSNSAKEVLTNYDYAPKKLIEKFDIQMNNNKQTNNKSKLEMWKTFNIF